MSDGRFDATVSRATSSEPLFVTAGLPFDAALRRARADFLEMPGLALTEVQAARLWGLDQALCRAVLTQLVTDGFLLQCRVGRFMCVAR